MNTLKKTTSKSYKLQGLDVTAVYTAGAKDGFVVSIGVEQIKERKI